MSKEFYDYLANRTIAFFNEYEVKSGEKFILKLDGENEVKNFYSAFEDILKRKNELQMYSRMDDELFETISFFTRNNVRLVIVPELDITNAYLTRLRNTIADEEKAAMLIVCNNPIDSIAGGTESLQKEGMPFHKTKLIKDIEIQIDKSALTTAERQVLRYDLDNKKSADFMDMYSLNDYESILTILYKERIDDDDFRKFGLFVDDEIKTISFTDKGTIAKRIETNNKYYKKIDSSLKFGNVDNDLDQDFDDILIKKIKTNYISASEKWDNDISFSDVLNSVKKKDKKLKPLEILSIEISGDSNPIRENDCFFVIDENKKGSKKSILIFNENKYVNFELTISLSDFPGKFECQFDDKKDNSVQYDSFGKRVILNITHNNLSVNKAKIRCIERDDKFDIAYCIINCNKSWFSDITSCFSINTKFGKKALIVNCNSENVAFNHHGTETPKQRLESELKLAYRSSERCVLIIDDDSFDDTGKANTVITIDGEMIPILFQAVAPINASISGTKIEQLTLKACQSFKYRGNNKLVFGTKEYNTREDLRIRLAIEDQLIKSKTLCGIWDDKLIPVGLNIGSEVLLAYNKFIDYFVNNDTLPSIAVVINFNCNTSGL